MIEQFKQEIEKINQEKDLTLVAVKSREILESLINYIYEKAGANKPKQATLLQLIDSPVIRNYFNDTEAIEAMHYIRMLGTNANHGSRIRKKDAKLSKDNIEFLIGFVDAKENGKAEQFKRPGYMSEAETRRLYVDLYLQEAGWNVQNKENYIVPGTAGIEIEVYGMPTDSKTGYCDYVLFGMDGKPLALVEAKKTSLKWEKGRHQADLYADCLEKKYGVRPVIYCSNGYETRVIDGRYPPRQVCGFHSRDELERMLQKRKQGKIIDDISNPDIAGRPYQQQAITSIVERLNAKQRSGLLVMATGTGKTRVAISLSDVLVRNKWIKTVLFLADRTALVWQAQRNFSRFLPSVSTTSLTGKNTDRDFDARFVFSTYQSMIKYIDAEKKRFTIGHFDLIIVDEAHRSIFNKYKSIFDYFDGLYVGLTATPKDDVDASTYAMFKCENGEPDFDYTMEDAIKEGYLVNYELKEKSSKIMSEGLHYNQLSKDEQEQLEDYYEDQEDGEEKNDIVPSEIFRHLYNKDTCRKVLNDLMTLGIRVDGGETLGKSIIFATNHDHAQMIVECFQEMYPEYPTEMCQLVDNYVDYANHLVTSFENDDVFRIAVSVDMLDTGVDIPSVLNLVFFKKMKSKIKFIQMIGRGTRTCPDLLGPEMDKEKFLIFDYCGNFRYFDEHPDGADGKETSSLTERVFQLKTEILYELQALEYQRDPWLKEYYEKLKSHLIKEVRLLKGHLERIQVRNEIRYVDKYCDQESWVSLDNSSLAELKKHISKQLLTGINGSEYAVRFDIGMYLIEISLLRNKSNVQAGEQIKKIREAAQYLLEHKASVPQVLALADELELLMSGQFWADADVRTVEEKRILLRDVMQFLKGKKKHSFQIDITDDIQDTGYVYEGPVPDIKSYRLRVEEYLSMHMDSKAVQKIYNLEKINAEDMKELEHVFWYDLGSEDEYHQTTDKDNLAVFVRSIIGLNQDAVNEKFGEFMNENFLNSNQLEFARTIIRYVGTNGDINRSDLVYKEPFKHLRFATTFEDKANAIIDMVDQIHESVICNE